jgi:hypothetical protein
MRDAPMAFVAALMSALADAIRQAASTRAGAEVVTELRA